MTLKCNHLSHCGVGFKSSFVECVWHRVSPGAVVRMLEGASGNGGLVGSWGLASMIAHSCGYCLCSLRGPFRSSLSANTAGAQHSEETEAAGPSKLRLPRPQPACLPSKSKWNYLVLFHTWGERKRLWPLKGGLSTICVHVRNQPTQPWMPQLSYASQSSQSSGPQLWVFVILLPEGDCGSASLRIALFNQQRLVRSRRRTWDAYLILAWGLYH